MFFPLVQLVSLLFTAPAVACPQERLLLPAPITVDLLGRTFGRGAVQKISALRAGERWIDFSGGDGSAAIELMVRKNRLPAARRPTYTNVSPWPVPVLPRKHVFPAGVEFLSASDFTEIARWPTYAIATDARGFVGQTPDVLAYLAHVLRHLDVGGTFYVSHVGDWALRFYYERQLYRLEDVAVLIRGARVTRLGLDSLAIQKINEAVTVPRARLRERRTEGGVLYREYELIR